MTSKEERFARRAKLLWLLTALLITAALVLAFGKIRADRHHADARADALASEAQKRGTAVSTLAGDVRALRAQVQAAGQSPVAPDPSKAVAALPERTAVPVPIPGPQGPPGAAASPVPGPTGAPGPAGAPGADSTVPGPAGSPGVQGVQGVPGTDGKDGKDGRDGVDGQPGAPGQPPAGWDWTDPAGQSYQCVRADDFDPSAPWYHCSPATTATPTPSPSSSPTDAGFAVLGVLVLAGSSSYLRL